ncbi:D-glycerate dehydrogenase [Pseudonocardia eucalypti]|uniref:D-glycerate dehydrogenase n=1 Tax=Pseudonocardia eucalypti TaxID=648755 RepID=A0ABP9QX75_9PSEU|nr:phosphoglycerate dehydrogenase-like enzyme [Pseudonocardia eucalypti]
MIGLCGGGFPDVRRALRTALPGIEQVEIPVGRHDGHRPPPVEVLVPLGATVDAELMDATGPRLIQQFGVGLQGVDLEAAHARGIPVAFVPATGTGNADAVAEIAMLHLLALLRRYREAQHSVAERRLGQPIGTTLAGKTISVLGTGGIGIAVIGRLKAFGVRPLAIGRRAFTDYPALADLLTEADYHSTTGLSAALARSGALIVCCPLTEHTRGLIGVDQLAAMPPGGYLVNVGRGPVVDYQALLAALRSGRLAGAGLDVTWQEPADPDDDLLRHNVSLTPHIGGVTVESYAAMAETFAENVRGLRTGQPLAHLVSRPTTPE